MFEIPVQLMVALAIGATAAPLEPRDGRLQPLAQIDLVRPAASARAGTTFTGPYLFRADAWLQSVRQVPDAGIATRVFTTSTGRAYVPDAGQRTRLLALREDRGLAEALAIETARRNTPALTATLKRRPSAGELLVAHLFGAVRAGAIITAAEQAPEMPVGAVAGLAPDDVALLVRIAPGERIGAACRRLTGPVDAALARVAARGVVRHAVAVAAD